MNFESFFYFITILHIFTRLFEVIDIVLEQFACFISNGCITSNLSLQKSSA